MLLGDPCESRSNINANTAAMPANAALHQWSPKQKRLDRTSIEKDAQPGHHSTRRSKNSHIRIETSQSSQWDHTLQGPIFTPPRQQPNINQLTKYVNFVATTTPHWTNNGKQTFLSQAFHSRQLSLRRSKNLDQKTSNTTKKYREDLRCGSLSTIPSEWLKS